jgi:hypothetical protein
MQPLQLLPRNDPVLSLRNLLKPNVGRFHGSEQGSTPI